MSARSNTLIVAAIAVLAVGAAGGFKVGTLYQERETHKTAVRLNLGHYDPSDASFQWGGVENIYSAKIADIMDGMEAVKPARKPQVPIPKHLEIGK